MRDLSLSIVLLILLGRPAVGAECPKAALSSAAADLQDARNALIDPARDMPAARSEMEMRVTAFILAYMRCQPENPDIGGIEVDLARLGWASTADDGAPADAGRQLTFKAQSFGQGLIGITAAFFIPSGTDAVSLTFRHDDDGWTEVKNSPAQ